MAAVALADFKNTPSIYSIGILCGWSFLSLSSESKYFDLFSLFRESASVSNLTVSLGKCLQCKTPLSPPSQLLLSVLPFGSSSSSSLLTLFLGQIGELHAATRVRRWGKKQRERQTGD